ncbi:hypothetical protein ACU4HD_12010 [Cupriavidus basilensis]
MSIPADLHTNPAYWQEYDCPRCGQDFDVSPVPERGTSVRCSCDTSWLAFEHEPNTYVVDADGNMICITYDLRALNYK